MAIKSFRQYISLLKTIRYHQKLSEKRHPAFAQNKAAKFFAYFGVVLTLLYLMFFAVTLAMIANSSDSVTPCELIYGFMPFILVIDFFSRFIVQQTPSQLVKPYVLMPIPRSSCIDSFIATSLFSWGNLTWFALFIPFSIMSVVFSEGVGTTLLFLLSLYLLILANSQWYLIIRALINRHILWWIAPAVVYALIFSPWYIGKDSGFSTLCDFYAGLGYYLVIPRLLAWVVIIAVFVVVVYINRIIQNISVWSELSHVEETKLKHVSQFTFFNRFGIIGEYIKLEAKSAMRNKIVRKNLIFSNTFVLLFSLAIAFTDIYDNRFMEYFLLVYCFSVYGSMILVRTMSAEGNYIDGLMVHRENILSLLTAKYYFYTSMLIVPFVLLIPTVIMGKYTILMLLSVMFFSAGVIHFSYMQFSIYNKQALPLNSKFLGKGNMDNNYVQAIASLAVFTVPIVLLYFFYYLFSDTIAYIIFLVIGLTFISLHRLWLKNIYVRLMKHRYVNMEGFRASR